MDSISHIVLGGAIGEAMLGKKLGRKGMLLGALANNLPDIDVLANAFMNPVDAMIFHRGITHSFFFGALISLILAFIFFKSYRKPGFTFKYWFTFFLVAIIAHDVIDYFTAYGTALLEPFSDKRFSANSIFVADPLFTIPLLISVFILLIIKGTREKRKKINRAGLIISCLYLLYTFINKTHVDIVMRKNLGKQHIAYTEYFTTPTALNNFLWYTVAKDKFGYHTGYYSVFDKKDTIEFNYFPRNELILILFPNDSDIEKLKKFSMGYYCFTKSDRSVYFNDIRFGQSSGPDSKFVFRYKVSADGKDAVLKRGDFDVSMKEAFVNLVKRIKGK